VPSIHTRAHLVSVRCVTMQREASASCVAEDGSDPPEPPPHLLSLPRPVVSLELFNRFVLNQDALNASLPDIPASGIDMDIDADADVDVVTSVPPTQSESVVPGISRDSSVLQEVSMKSDRKRVGGEDAPWRAARTKESLHARILITLILRHLPMQRLRLFRQLRHPVRILLPMFLSIITAIGHLSFCRSNPWTIRKLILFILFI